MLCVKVLTAFVWYRSWLRFNIIHQIQSVLVRCFIKRFCCHVCALSFVHKFYFIFSFSFFFLFCCCCYFAMTRFVVPQIRFDESKMREKTTMTQISIIGSSYFQNTNNSFETHKIYSKFSFIIIIRGPSSCAHNFSHNLSPIYPIWMSEWMNGTDKWMWMEQESNRQWIHIFYSIQFAFLSGWQ